MRKNIALLYNTLDELIDRLDFNSIWPGFKRFDFALYTEEEVYLRDKIIPYDQRFIGNTSIEYENSYIAIWSIESDLEDDPVILAGNIVHEMFHAFQQSKNEQRYPNELLSLDYPDNVENNCLKYLENNSLIEAFLSDNSSIKYHSFIRYLSIRKYREKLLGSMISEEYKTETIEGLAEYAGMMALKQLSYDKYIRVINGHLDKLRSVEVTVSNMRKLAYSSGTLLAMMMHDLDFGLFHDIGSENRPLFHLIDIETALPESFTLLKERAIEKATQSIIHDKQKKFDEFFSSDPNEVSGDFRIIGYDPMNMIKLGNKILCTHFILLASQETSHFITGPVVAVLKDESINEVCSYAHFEK